MPEQPLDPAKKQPKPFKPLPLCRYIMPTGRRCGSPRLRNDPYSCYFHAPLSVRRHGQPSPLPFSRLRGTERELLVEAKTKIRQRLANREPVSRRDRIILYGLQIMLNALGPQPGPNAKTASKKRGHRGNL